MKQNHHPERSRSQEAGITQNKNNLSVSVLILRLRDYFGAPESATTQGALFRALSPIVRHAAVGRLREHPEIIDDAAQEAMTRLIAKGRILGDPALDALVKGGAEQAMVRDRFLRTVHAVVTQAAIDTLRSESRWGRLFATCPASAAVRSRHHDDSAATDRYNPRKEVSRRELLRCIRRLPGLNDKEIRVIDRVFRLEETAAEAAQAIGASRSASYRAVERAKRQLRRKIAR